MSTDAAFDLEAASALLAEVFAPCVQDLGLSVDSVGEDRATLRMAFSDRLCRESGVICGQALMSLADTATVFAVSAASGRYRPMTTVDLTCHFMRPVASKDVLATARIMRMGRSMAFAHVELAADGDPRPVASATTAYALLPEPEKK